MNWNTVKKIFIPLTSWLFGALILTLPFLYLTSEKRIQKERKYWDDIDTILKMESTKGSDTDLMKAFESKNKAIEYNYKIVLDPETKFENKAIAERSALHSKLGMMKLLMDIDPKFANYDWKIIEFKEVIQFTKELKTLHNQFHFKLKYESGAPTSIMPLELFFELGTAPPKDLKESLVVENILINKKYSTDEIEFDAVGTQGASSPLCKITIPVKLTDLRNGKIIELCIKFPPVNQKFPYSLYSHHIHRYKRGVNLVEVFMDFDLPVNIVHFDVDETRRPKIIKLPENFKIINKKERDDGRTLKYHFKIINPKKPIVMAFLMYNKAKNFSM